MQEIWKDIEGYEGFYKISNYGNVYSCERTVVYERRGSLCSRKYDGKLMKQEIDKDGYKTVNLKNEKGKKKHEKIHRLVANAFLENPNNYSCVNHKNEIKTDNNVDNLEWCSVKYNNNYGTRKNRIKNNKNSISRWQMNHNDFAIPVIQCDLNGKEIKKFCCARHAALEVNRCASGITACCRNRDGRVSCGGYTWKYAK